MNEEQKYLTCMLITVLALSAIAIWDGWLIEWSNWKIIAIFLMNIFAYGIAFYVQKWYGQSLIFLHILLKAPVSLLVGLICALIGNSKICTTTSYIVGSLPIIVFIFAMVSYSQGLTPTDWSPKITTFGPYAVVYSLFWFVTTRYVYIVIIKARKRKGYRDRTPHH